MTRKEADPAVFQRALDEAPSLIRPALLLFSALFSALPGFSFLRRVSRLRVDDRLVPVLAGTRIRSLVSLGSLPRILRHLRILFGTNLHALLHGICNRRNYHVSFVQTAQHLDRWTIVTANLDRDHLDLLVANHGNAISVLTHHDSIAGNGKRRHTAHLYERNHRIHARE